MHNTPLHILKFYPISKEKLWGGTKLKQFLGKQSSGNQIGESWEISDVPENYSIVSEGKLKEASLHELLITYKEDLVGKKNYARFGNEFPLLIKFIDASKDLSVQLHPDDHIARAKHNSLGKTEMWYVVQADTDARIIMGFNKTISKEQYQNHVENKTIEDVLHYENVSPGDTFFVPPGLIHAIGKGVLLAEIQQTSDITYRIYDWDRRDTDGKLRELHQQEALEAINFETKENYAIPYHIKNNQLADLVTCAHFITKIIQVDHEIDITHKDLDSFVIYMCVEGNATIKNGKDVIDIRFGETVLVPAIIKDIKITSKGVKLLQTYI